ncbi:Auxin responsive saur protein [Thalictrum thalictroides]|uniref:Auxin responsive saur protein n=1 Tax=Thalictrum thalictroides TaxID=46969 RepID=A0A7J6WGP4_THATH|nr:Auxin responsive saur protein [Thalictrum thalictroides]
MKKINILLSKCKSLSRQLGGSSSYSSLGSKSVRERFWGEDENHQVILVGRSKKRYMINSKYLNHPVLNALIERSTTNDGKEDKGHIYVKCEVVLLDHLLWMLENSNLNFSCDESLMELAELYVY